MAYQSGERAMIVTYRNYVFFKKKIVRAITFSDFKAHSAPTLKKLGILELKDLFKYKTTYVNA